MQIKDDDESTHPQVVSVQLASLELLQEQGEHTRNQQAKADVDFQMLVLYIGPHEGCPARARLHLSYY